MSGEQTEARGLPFCNSRDLKRLFLKDFDQLNRFKKDGMLTINEVDTAVVDRSIHGEDAQLITALKEYFGPLSKLTNNQTGPESGITLADIEKFDEIQQRVNSSTKENPAPQGEQMLVRSIDWAMAETRYAADSKSACLYGDPDNPNVCVVPEAVHPTGENAIIKSISATAFQQGRIGDCFFEAGLGTLAAMDPQSIVKMIKDNHDGTYTVTFPISPKEPITVPGPTECERAMYTRTYSYDNPKRNFGDWPIVMEKAFGEWCINRPLRIWRRSPAIWLRGDRYGKVGKIIPQENADGGSMFHRGLMALAGKWIHTDYSAITSEDKLDKNLKDIMDRKCGATAFIRRRIGAVVGLQEDLTEDAKLLCGHEYAVLDYDPKTREVTIREPNGYFEPCKPGGKPEDPPEDGVRDGVFKISLERFRKNFTGLSYPLK